MEKKQRGRPHLAPEKTKGEYLEVRVDMSEKQRFKEAADAAGVPLSSWVRERLRKMARQEFGEIGKKIAFLENGGPASC